jgi:hypothetical protein
MGRPGAAVRGDRVHVGIGATIAGKIRSGDGAKIAANTFRGGRAFCSGSKAGAERPRNSPAPLARRHSLRPAPGKQSGAAPKAGVPIAQRCALGWSDALAGPGRTGVPGPSGAQAGRAADPEPPTRSGARWGGQPRWGPRQAMVIANAPAGAMYMGVRGCIVLRAPNRTVPAAPPAGAGTPDTASAAAIPGPSTPGARSAGGTPEEIALPEEAAR